MVMDKKAMIRLSRVASIVMLFISLQQSDNAHLFLLLMESNCFCCR
jgi:hypothetical protein